MQVIRRKIEQWGGIEVSRLGFGAMRLPVGGDRKIDWAKAAAMVDKAVESGVNYFDTAYLYHGGESELFLGEALKKYPRDSYYLATKMPPHRVETEDEFYRIFEEQLHKLQTDHIDFYLLHGLSAIRLNSVRQLNMVDKLAAMKKAGKIRFMGFSYHGDTDTFRELIDMGVWDFAQIQINYLDYAMINAKALYDKLTTANIPCICMEPIRGGWLANPPDEAKSLMAGFGGSAATPAGWGFRWCIDKDNLAVILSGMNTLEQVEENTGTFASDSKLTPAQNEMLAKVSAIITGAKTVPCTACRYCMDCPAGVDIPEVFRIYNHFKTFKNAFRAGEDYKALIHFGHGVDKCTRCGACSLQCPQEISIPEELDAIKDILLNAQR